MEYTCDPQWDVCNSKTWFGAQFESKGSNVCPKVSLYERMGILRLLTELLRINGNIFRAVFRLTFGAVLLEAKSSGRLYLNSAWHLSATSVSWKMSFQCSWMLLSKLGDSCVYIRMALLILVDG